MNLAEEEIAKHLNGTLVPEEIKVRGIPLCRRKDRRRSSNRGYRRKSICMDTGRWN